MKTTITVTLTLAQADALLRAMALNVPLSLKNMVFLNGACRIEEEMEKAIQANEEEKEGLTDQIIDAQLEKELGPDDYWTP